MRKILGTILLIFMILSISSQTVYSNKITNSQKTYVFEKKSSDLLQKDWTLMIYADGDFSGGGLLIDYFLYKNLASTEHLNIIIIQDDPNNPTSIWSINEENEKKLLDEPGELNMGNKSTLENFINYSKQQFPAERYMLIFWDHGYAWGGACVDITSNNDRLTMDEMQQALLDSNGVDIVGFSACRMGCIESAYELRECTDVYFGSEEQNGANCWPWLAITNILDEYCQESTYFISDEIMNEFKLLLPYFGTIDNWMESIRALFIYHIFPYPPATTMSALRTDKLEDLINSVNTFSEVLIDNYNQLINDIINVRLRVEDFPRPMRLNAIFGSTIDLYHFASLIDKAKFRQTIPSLHDSAQDLKESINQAIIDEHHQLGHRNANGVAIYMPPKHTYSFDKNYSNCNLDFTDETVWDEFLELYNEI